RSGRLLCIRLSDKKHTGGGDQRYHLVQFHDAILSHSAEMADTTTNPGNVALTNVTHCYQPIQETYDMHARKLLIATLLTLALPAVAAEKTAEVHAVTADGIGEKIGTVTFADSTE